MTGTVRSKTICTCILVLASFGANALFAADIKIVSLGASQTSGKGVVGSQAYPAQLQQLLNAEGYSVTVVNEGREGDTTNDLAARLDRAVPEGVRLVILQPGANDRGTRRKMSVNAEQTRANVEEMLAKLETRKIKAILLGFPGSGGEAIAETHHAMWYGQPGKDVPREMLQADGQHFTAAGYARLAGSLLPLVKPLIGEPQK